MTPICQAGEHARGRDGTSGSVSSARWRGNAGTTFGVKTLAAASLLFLGACTGDIEGDVGGMKPTPQQPPSGNPSPPAEGAPVVGEFATAPAPSTRFARLSHRQWENTVSDLFKGTAPRNLSRDFITEPTRSSFDNNGSILQVSNDLRLDYERAASSLATAARNPTTYGMFLPVGVKTSKAFIQNFGLKAYRRPLTDAEVTDYEALFAKAAEVIASPDAFADGVELVVTAMLQSVHFLYRPELNADVVKGRVPLTSFEVATRLSYSLVNSMPDDALFAAATSNKLVTRAEVLVHATRLLDSERGKETLRDLHVQMLKLSDFTEIVRDTTLFPQFKTGMGDDMKSEAETFVLATVGENKGLVDLLTAPYTYVNSRLAPLYGVNVPTPAAGQPDPFVKVDLDPTQRGGLFTQVGFLAATATDQAPRSIQRGVHINLDVLCAELPAPPDVPPAPPSNMGRTNRQLLEAFTEMPGSVCTACHGTLINPVGFAFENYDGLGKYRTTEANGLPIDAKSSYEFESGRKSFNGATELMKIIAGERQTHNCYSQHLFEYLYGRDRIVDGEHKAADDTVISEVGRRSNQKVSIKSMILDLVSTDAFLTRLN